MLPLAMGNVGETYAIKKIGGSGKTRQRLEELGFVVGTYVKIISSVDGNLIINIRDSRVAVSQSMALKIMV